MKKAPVRSLQGALALLSGLILLGASGCTTGTDVSDSATASDERARLDRIAVTAQRLVAKAKAEPQKPASALAADLASILQEAEAP